MGKYIIIHLQAPYKGSKDSDDSLRLYQGRLCNPYDCDSVVTCFPNEVTCKSCLRIMELEFKDCIYYRNRKCIRVDCPRYGLACKTGCEYYNASYKYPNHCPSCKNLGVVSNCVDCDSCPSEFR